MVAIVIAGVPLAIFGAIKLVQKIKKSYALYKANQTIKDADPYDVFFEKVSEFDRTLLKSVLEMEENTKKQMTLGQKFMELLYAKRHESKSVFKSLYSTFKRSYKEDDKLIFKSSNEHQSLLLFHSGIDQNKLDFRQVKASYKVLKKLGLKSSEIPVNKEIKPTRNVQDLGVCGYRFGSPKLDLGLITPGNYVSLFFSKVKNSFQRKEPKPYVRSQDYSRVTLS